jgi:hypothetical protein
LGIGTRTYYDHVERFGKAAYLLAPSIQRASERMFSIPTREIVAELNKNKLELLKGISKN